LTHPLLLHPPVKPTIIQKRFLNVFLPKILIVLNVLVRLGMVTALLNGPFMLDDNGDVAVSITVKTPDVYCNYAMKLDQSTANTGIVLPSLQLYLLKLVMNV